MLKLMGKLRWEEGSAVSKLCSHPRGSAEPWYLVDGLQTSLPGRAIHFVCLEEKAPQKELG